MNILITGGAGFIGTALVEYLLANTPHQLLVLDKLTYAANLTALEQHKQNARLQFVQGDICDASLLQTLFADFQPDAIMHLAAESHVDRSLSGPAEFMQTNIIGSYNLLEASRHYWQQLIPARQAQFRFLQVSTDEVFGDLGNSGVHLNKKLFTENHAYAPSSPYSASKASADHLVQAWHRSYGLPTLISYCSNNYGPWQHAEKLIPKAINHLLQGKPVPLYGDGLQIRDWLYVDDHVAALYLILTQGKVGQSYAIGGNSQVNNLALVQRIADIIDSFAEQGLCQQFQQPRRELIEFVTDRPGHDQCYGIDNTKISQQLNWQPQYSLQQGLEKTLTLSFK
ncbi:dTDP-glucose 4,6-dehydratase [Rheinheimera salexigens]|uniref:dTDP-glucose 4,6-dehydratase n=1 Tax=Rheinheimera salexigens TaxID=1628148 RepID=UPI000AEFD69A|nr:dTDP-glucose 4,6-dehydratase [Rheinheimera salexigens]